MDTKNRYDVFVSYRREASESAQLVATHLRAAGYRVFIDVEALRAGKFNEQLYEVIDNCKDFLVILPENALDRCSSPDDWVRKEVCRAIAGGKNIIPVMLNGFTWPDPMPEGMEQLKDYQAVSATSHEYFDLSMQRLAKYLKSRSHARFKKVLAYLGISIAALALLALIGMWILRTLSIPVCKKVVEDMTLLTSCVELCLEQNDRVVKEWDQFVPTFQSAAPEEKEALLSELSRFLDKRDEELDKLLFNFSAYKTELTPFQVFQLGLRDISVDDILAAYPVSYSVSKDIKTNVQSIRDVLADGVLMPKEDKVIRDRLEFSKHAANVYYFSYLHALCGMPRQTLHHYWKLSPVWVLLPNDIGPNRTKAEYEQLTDREFKILEGLSVQMVEQPSAKEGAPQEAQ